MFDYKVWYVIGVILIAALGYWRLHYVGNKVAAAERLITQQCNKASQKDIADFSAYARSRGYGDEFLRELGKVRLAYGTDHVKIGHLIWIDMKISGDIDGDEKAPSFASTE